MSVSRPKHGRIIVRPPPVTIPQPSKAAIPLRAKSKAVATTSKSAASTTRVKPLGASEVAARAISRPSPTTADKGKSKALPSIALPYTTSSSQHVHPASSSSEDEDDFEEVQIPSEPAQFGASSSYPGTPNTPNIYRSQATTPGTINTNPSVDYDFAGNEDVNDEDEDDDDDEEGEEEKGSGVIRVEIGGETAEQKAKRIMLALRKKPMTSKDRALRLEAHKMHVIALLASAKIRNKWCSNPLLKARLLSLLPHPLAAAFTIPPSRYPDRAKRSRLFFDALQSLVTWWTQAFFDISDPTIGLRTRPWDEVQEIVDKLPKLSKADLTGSSFLTPSATDVKKGKGKETEYESLIAKLEENSGGEKLRSVNSLMKKVLQQEGSRDVSAQLFVALARACGLGARLVVSLQPVPWRAEKVVAKKKPGAGRGGKTLASRQGVGPPSAGEEDSDEDDLEEVPIPLPDGATTVPENGGILNQNVEGGPSEVVEKIQTRRGIRGAGPRRLQDPADLYRLKKVKPPPQKLGSTSKPKAKKEDLSQQPPVFWAEIFSRSDQRWIPVDPLRAIIRKKSHFEPTSDNGPIRMSYVVGFEEDGYARDVTLRYAKNFGAKTVKLRVPGRKDEPEWWSEVTGFLQRPYRLNRDELEDAEFETSHLSEGMPMHMNGFKDHPIYVLERHLKREEAILPKREIGRFKGEPVYRRANVLTTKTAENWMRIGRRVKEKQEPLKWVKQRAVTLQKRRAQELAVQESGEPILQGLYSENQTEIYRPPPIVDGKIPQNSFGNLDLYVPTMLPAGAVHLPYKGIAKIAKQLGISYAEACTGFEFKKQRAIPVITGIVVAVDQEALVLDAYWESAAAAEERATAKKEEKALKRWTKLINGLRVRQRLQAEYGDGQGLHEQQHNPLADPAATTPSKSKVTAAAVIASANMENQNAWVEGVRERSASFESDPASPEVKIESRTSPYFNEVTAEPQNVQNETQSADRAEDVPEVEEEVNGVINMRARNEDIDSEVDESKGIPIGDQGESIEVSKPTIKLRIRQPSPINGFSEGKPDQATPNRKRKVSDEEEINASESDGDEDGDFEVPSSIRRTGPAKGGGRGRGKGQIQTKTTPRKAIAKSAVSSTRITRSLRSQAPKTEEQELKEKERRERVKAALESEAEDDDEDL